MLDALASLARWLGLALGVALFSAMIILAFATLRKRRVVMMQRDADERIKAFHDRHAVPTPTRQTEL
jgi:hypothetical protein